MAMIAACEVISKPYTEVYLDLVDSFKSSSHAAPRKSRIKSQPTNKAKKQRAKNKQAKQSRKRNR